MAIKSICAIPNNDQKVYLDREEHRVFVRTASIYVLDNDTNIMHTVYAGDSDNWETNIESIMNPKNERGSSRLSKRYVCLGTLGETKTPKDLYAWAKDGFYGMAEIENFGRFFIIDKEKAEDIIHISVEPDVLNFNLDSVEVDVRVKSNWFTSPTATVNFTQNGIEGTRGASSLSDIANYLAIQAKYLGRKDIKFVLDWEWHTDSYDSDRECEEMNSRIKQLYDAHHKNLHALILRYIEDEMGKEVDEAPDRALEAKRLEEFKKKYENDHA